MPTCDHVRLPPSRSKRPSPLIPIPLRCAFDERPLFQVSATAMLRYGQAAFRPFRRQCRSRPKAAVQHSPQQGSSKSGSDGNR